ncbi:Hypothetical_protein [Hexamita inflata]|uniref:Hypothetical_protein n=1 Tax=Hexamita inflata TaxID=28002 RepID=A0AA86TZ67_9EUKA|nr:Hypothetical protein HINF_LOCUS21631 [Hexamita inflata]
MILIQPEQLHQQLTKLTKQLYLNNIQDEPRNQEFAKTNKLESKNKQNRTQDMREPKVETVACEQILCFAFESLTIVRLCCLEEVIQSIVIIVLFFFSLFDLQSYQLALFHLDKCQEQFYCQE